jgi:phage baseplate assembly protein gpV
MHGLTNQFRRAAQEAGASQATTRHGIVTSYDPGSYAVKVELQPDGTLTGWIPLKSPWVGNGWGLFCPPSIGDLVEVDFQEADGGVGSAGWRFYNDQDRPLPCPAGEFWLVHESGTSVKLTNDGTLALDTGQGASILLNAGNITSAGTWTHTGTLTANGIGLTTHRHTGVQTGSGNTLGPQA